MNKTKYIFVAIAILFIVGLSRNFLGSLDQNKIIPFDRPNIPKKQDTTNVPHASNHVTRNNKVFPSGNFFSSFFFPHPEEEYISTSSNEPSISAANDETTQPSMDEQQELELFIQDAAIQNIPIDLVTLGRLKEYYIDANNLVGFQQFLESLPDSYEMKNELLSDLAFLYQEHGQINESVNLIQSLSSRDANDVRLKYYKADIYLGAGNDDVAINTLLEASQINEEPYQYTKIAEILEDAGDGAAAAYYFERADALEAIMHHNE
jgi:tetratricopeptide (TPR) repeat protein